MIVNVPAANDTPQFPRTTGLVAGGHSRAAFLAERLIAALVLAVILAGCGEQQRAPANAAACPAEPVDVRHNASVRAVEVVMPSVVNIATATIKQYRDFYDPIFQQFFGPVHQREELYNIGSGVIIDENGYVLSNLHVMQRATRAQVKLWDGRVYDVESYTYAPGSDIALLKLRTKPGEKFKAITFAANDDLLLGETVLALGNPFGLGGSVTQGILSSKNRRGPLAEVAPNVQEWLQTDAAINPGNSGGPLVNLNGELIGLNSAVGEGQGISFAIPVKQIGIALAELLSPETTDFLWFGARVMSDRDVLRIDFVQPGSPADQAGLQTGQQILDIDGSRPGTLPEFNRLIVKDRGQEATLRVQKGADIRTVKVRLIPFVDMIRDKLGLVFSKLAPENAARFNINNGEGLIIDQVEKGGPADAAQLQHGYLVTAMDGKSARDLLAVANVISGKPSGSMVQVNVVVPSKLDDNTYELHPATVSLKLR